MIKYNPTIEEYKQLLTSIHNLLDNERLLKSMQTDPNRPSYVTDTRKHLKFDALSKMSRLGTTITWC